MRWQPWTTWSLNFRNWATSWETSADTRTRLHDRKTIMTWVFCHSFSWGDSNKSNAAALLINIFPYSAVLVVSFLQCLGCILRLLSALAVLQSCMFWFLRPRFLGTDLLVFIRQLLRISSARVHHSHPLQRERRRGGNSRSRGGSMASLSPSPAKRTTNQRVRLSAASQSAEL